MKYIVGLCLLLVSIHTSAQNYKSNYDTSRDEETGSLVFNGVITINDLAKEASFDWMKSSADYQPADQDMAILKKYLPGYELVVFMGTWCSDSHDIIPKLVKVLQLADYPLTHLTLYGTDRSKTVKGGEEKRFNIKLVPTIILYHNKAEIGRITESVSESVEHDLSVILKRDLHQ